MTNQIPVNASAFSTYMELSAEEIISLPFYETLFDLHASYAEGKYTDIAYSAAMDELIAANPSYAENLNHLKTRLLAHI